jgi:hypothetical protein
VRPNRRAAYGSPSSPVSSRAPIPPSSGPHSLTCSRTPGSSGETAGVTPSHFSKGTKVSPRVVRVVRDRSGPALQVAAVWAARRVQRPGEHQSDRRARHRGLPFPHGPQQTRTAPAHSATTIASSPTTRRRRCWNSSMPWHSAMTSA